MCMDVEITRKLRSVGKEILKEIGKKLLHGDLRLTTITFPIRCCHPKSALETSLHGCILLI